MSTLDELIQQCETDAANYLRTAMQYRTSCQDKQRQVYLGQHRYASMMVNRLKALRNADQDTDAPATHTAA
jgi:hypothetical protein